MTAYSLSSTASWTPPQYHLPMRTHHTLTIAAALLALTACSSDPTPAPHTTTITAPATQTQTQTQPTTPSLKPVVEQFIETSNNTIGQDYTQHLRTFATPECANTMIAFGTTNTSQPTRLVTVTQHGTTGTSTTALRDNPNDQGSTLHWTYTDRWRFTCDGIFQ